MKSFTPFKPALIATAIVLLGSAPLAKAGSFFSDFESGQPANTAVFGSALVDTTGGLGGGGCLKLTDTGASEVGVFIITNDLDSGAPVMSFAASFKMTVGGGTGGGDGFSFNFATNLDLTGSWGSAAEGY